MGVIWALCGLVRKGIRRMKGGFWEIFIIFRLGGARINN
jgi:hypothetical protein